jgi:starvation-inducible outer membrane lipoprotein
MAQRFIAKTFCAVLLAGAVCFALPVAEVHAQQPNAAQKQSQKTLTAGQAARKAKARHGGKVLKVTPKGKGFKVKLLTDSGRVLTVMIKD